MRFAPIWQNGLLVYPAVKEPEFKSEARFYIKPAFFKSKETGYWIDFLKSLSLLLSATCAFIEISYDCEIKINNIEDVNKLQIYNFWVSYYDKEFSSLLKNVLSDTQVDKTLLEDDKYYLVISNAANKNIIKT